MGASATRKPALVASPSSPSVSTKGFDPARKITSEEMVEMFGETMPLEAVDMLFNSDGSMTVGEMRAALRKLAEERKRPFDPACDEAVVWRTRGYEPACDDPLVTAAFAWADATSVSRGSGAFGTFVRAFIAGAVFRDSDGPRMAETNEDSARGEAGPARAVAEGEGIARKEGP